MSQLNFALFESEEAAAPAVKELSTRTDAHPNFMVCTFDRTPLDGSVLPESGTEVGRNTLIATVIGVACGAPLGLAVGLSGKVVGVSAGIGVAIGTLFGGFAGLLNGLMAGAREPKAPLKALAQELGQGKVLMAVETDDRGHSDLVCEILRTSGGSGVGSC